MEINLSLLKFCGMFGINELQKSLLLDSKYFRTSQIPKGSDVWQYIHDQYYPSFRNFITNEDAENFNDFKILESQPELTTNRYQATLKKTGGSKTIEFSILRVELFLYSQSPGILALEVVPDSTGLDLNDISAFNNWIRNYHNKISDPENGGKELTILELIEDLILNKAIGKNLKTDENRFNLGDESKISDYRGSKLKVFQCFDLKSTGGRDLRKILFELGTLSAIRPHDESSDYNAHSEEYYKETVTHAISVYKNWMALCLFDTFTLVGIDYLHSAPILETWKENYFRIYTYDLYYKYYLSSLNAEGFHEAKRLKKKRKEFNDFFHLYDIHYISYNFLPNLIHHSIKKGLETGTETEGLRDKIDRITKIINERITERTNWILFGLSVIALIPGNWGDIYNSVGTKEHPAGYNQANILVNFIKILIILLIFLVQFSAFRRIRDFFYKDQKGGR